VLRPRPESLAGALDVEDLLDAVEVTLDRGSSAWLGMKLRSSIVPSSEPKSVRSATMPRRSTACSTLDGLPWSGKPG
jgi:hypothetical protein